MLQENDHSPLNFLSFVAFTYVCSFNILPSPCSVSHSYKLVKNFIRCFTLLLLFSVSPEKFSEPSFLMYARNFNRFFMSQIFSVFLFVIFIKIFCYSHLQSIVFWISFHTNSIYIAPHPPKSLLRL